jgi:predicted transcriptional regulator YdeE
MAKAVKAKKAPKGKAAKSAKPKRATKAAKRSTSKAAPKRKTAKKATRASKTAPKKVAKKATRPTKAKTAPKRKVVKTSAPAAKAKPAPRRKPVKRATPRPAKPTATVAPATPPASGMAPRFEESRAFAVAGLGGRYTAATNREIPALWQQFGPRWFGQVPGQVGRKAYGVCANFDGQGNFDYVAAVEIDAAGATPAELMQMTIPAGRYAVFEHSDHISAIGKTWMEIYSKWLPGSGKRAAKTPSFELYHETFDPAVGVGGIEIWIPIED